jgi:hypothetical protein
MSDPSAPPMRPRETRARERVAILLAWAGTELGFPPTAMRPCDADLVAAAQRSQGVASLAAAHEELLLRAGGGGGPDSALVQIFGDDLVGVDAMSGEPGSAPLRQAGLELIESLGYGLDEFDVVIRVRRGEVVEYVVTGSPDPPVWAFAAGVEDPALRHPSFTAWLEHRVQRAVKRRFPLKRVVPPEPAVLQT